MSTQTPTRDGTVLLTPADAARVANVSRDTIYREIERGALPVRHVGRRWQIQIPHRSRSDSLTDVAEASRELPTDEERAVVRQLVLGEIVGGSATTVGDLHERIEKAAPEQRREMLDDARVKAGLPTTGDVVIDAVKRADGVREIRELDVFEVSATPTPMNGDTRVLSTKALHDLDQVRTKARDDMLELLSATPEPVATKGLPKPVQIASFEC